MMESLLEQLEHAAVVSRTKPRTSRSEVCFLLEEKGSRWGPQSASKVQHLICSRHSEQGMYCLYCSSM